MMTESALLNCCTSIVFVIPYARGNTVSNIFQELVAYNSVRIELLIWSGLDTDCCLTDRFISVDYCPCCAGTRMDGKYGLRYHQSSVQQESSITWDWCYLHHCQD
jgi:hypothetical protein